MRNAAAVLIESGNLLMLDARPVDKEQWMTVSRGLSDAAAKVLEAAEAKDVEASIISAGSPGLQLVGFYPLEKVTDVAVSPNRILAEKGATRVKFACKQCDHKQETL